MSKKKIKATERKKVKEAVDIIRHVDDDDLARQFLQDTLDEDYFPDMDLGSMDLHEAVEELDRKTKRRKMSAGQKIIADLTSSLDDFMKKHDEMKRKKDAERRKREREMK